MSILPGRIWIFLLIALPLNAVAQQTIRVPLPSIEIWADKLEHGDCDTFGKGTWMCSVETEIEGDELTISAKIWFLENSGDSTRITGAATRKMKIPSLKDYSACTILNKGGSGRLNGVNIGARSFRNYEGQGIIRSGYIQTDTHGCDVGKIGGKLTLKPLYLKIYCDQT